MPLDPSIYNQVGRVNLGQGLSDILDQQRQREMQREQQATTLASLAQQQELGALNIGKLKREEAMVPQQMAQKRNQELNMWLSSAVQSGRPQEEVMAEAIAKGAEIGVAPEVTQRHVQSVFASAQAPQTRSDFAFSQAYPELVAKQRAESMFARPASQAAPSAIGKLFQEREALPPNDPRRAIYDAAIKKETERAPQAAQDKLVAVADQTGQPVLMRESQAAGMRPAAKTGAKLSAAAEKELFEADDNVTSSQNVISSLKEALNINDKAYSGYGAKERAVLRGNLPGQSEEASATIMLDNIMTGQGLESLKATFGGMPTEGERKILLDLQAAPDKPPKVRKAIIERAIVAAERRMKLNKEKADKLRKGEYFTPQETQDEWSDL